MSRSLTPKALSNATPLARQAVPGLLIAGRDAEVIGRDNLERARRAWGVDLVWIDDAGHFSDVEQPEDFSTVVTEWVHGQRAEDRPRLETTIAAALRSARAPPAPSPPGQLSLLG